MTKEQKHTPKLAIYTAITRTSWTPISNPVLAGFQLSFAPQSDEESNSKGAEAGGQAAAQEHGHGVPQPPQKQKI